MKINTLYLLTEITEFFLSFIKKKKVNIIYIIEHIKIYKNIIVIYI